MAIRGEALRRSAPAKGPVAVVDIGSNSVRLVVFDTEDRTLRPLFNEKVLCGLGRSLNSTGRLDQEGIALARTNLLRFTRLTRAMGVGQMDLVATAAVRDAEDGPAFVQEVEQICERPVQVLDGIEEGRLAAVGVLAGLPDAAGVVGDLGGGSLELVEIKDGKTARSTTLPLGPLRLAELCGGRIGAMRREVDRQLAEVDWIAERAAESDERVFYPVGGAWRNLARLHMEQHSYPLHVVHGYRMRRSQIESVESVVSRMGPHSLARIRGISRRRLEVLPTAAVILARVLKALRYKDVLFSAYGLREGYIFDALPQRQRDRDPLIAAAEQMAETGSRFGGMCRQLMTWTAPLFPGESREEERLRMASCLLSDIAWREHTDYRARLALHRILYFPFAGITHSQRAFLAYACFTRYGGTEESEEMSPLLGLFSAEAERRARVLGLAQRLAYQVSGATGTVLALSALRLDDSGRLSLRLPGDEVTPGRGSVERRLEALGEALEASEVSFDD